MQIDEWILQFVDLLKEHCGIDPDKPLECQEVGAGPEQPAGRQPAPAAMRGAQAKQHEASLARTARLRSRLDIPAPPLT